jgi:hypothetical protein
MANFEILISSHKYSPEQIKSVLTNLGVWDSTWKIQKQESGILSRGLDPTILVAIVGATGTAVGALIAGLLQLVNGKKDEKIVLRTSSGMTIEFPANLSSKRLDEMINKLKQLEDEGFQILLP